MSGFLTAKDESNVNGDNKIETHLPVHAPYWTKKRALENTTTPQFGLPGVRATWIGHATVLAEVDEAIVLCDPIFRFVINWTKTLTTSILSVFNVRTAF